MKKAILISLAILAAQAPAVAGGETKPVTVLLAGGDEANMIHIWLTPDGRTYVIDSVVALEVGGSVCTNAPGNANELLCQAPMIGGFEINAGGGDDKLSVARQISIPVTMRGGPGRDHLIGGMAPDKLIGGAGADRLIGGPGGDLLAGGPGNDVLVGGPGDDILLSGPGINDVVRGGSGEDYVRRYAPRAKSP
jgi:Ca2+-binding RTX toxin-like protein